MSEEGRQTVADPKKPDNELTEAEAVDRAGKVATAGAEAAEQGQDVAGAMRQEAQRVQLDIPDDVLDRMADAISSKNIAALEQRGAFEQPPEPVRPPEAAETAPDHPNEPAPEPDEPAPAPVKRTWAHKFLGV